ncbi:PAAR-like protein [Flavobacterium chilense]|uniref:DUF4280 domain-containing protein n=1 Tax=Flavobacterium chilense TaxID=946677 RepID=A0A1M7ETG3_9FLAO|nr:PAAR-like protein [Flavobacterium chilense]SHL95044.1 protein of unknown function [Flavobacterium chilense]
MAKPDNTLKRKMREEKENAEDGLKFVIDGAKISCDLCTVPDGDLKANFDTPSIQDKRVVTVVEKDMTSLIFKGNCKKSPYSSSPCASVMKLTDWKDPGTVYFQDQLPVLLRSTIKCEYGGVDIKITDCGQRNLITNIDTIGAPVPSPKEIAPFKCTYCEEEITLKQIRYVITGKVDGKLNDESKVKEIIELLNKYRIDFKLDTCLRKAHFISQVGAESKFESTYEGSTFPASALSIFNQGTTRFRNNQEIDDVVLESLNDYLINIFKIVDKNGEIVTKSNTELKTILKTQKIIVDEKELYGKYGGEKDPKNSKKRVDKLLKEVLNPDKTINYQIYLKIHSSFGIPILSRAYANRFGNGDEMSRDGWKFRGKGIKQITFKDNYKNFTKFRKANPFPDDKTGDIDFTLTTDNIKLEGNFDKVANNTIYGVQSANWFWIEGNGSVYKNGDLDDVKKVTKAVNGGHNGLEIRNKYTILARQDNGFKVFKHYKLEYENGTDEEKKKVIARLNFLLEVRNQKDSATKKIVNFKDDNAKSLLDELEPNKEEKLKK